MKLTLPPWRYRLSESPSMRREWIEIASCYRMQLLRLSPSMRREWIEIFSILMVTYKIPSPSMRREWIEIIMLWVLSVLFFQVSLHAEGVD